MLHSHNLKTRYHEHIRYIKNNNPQSACAQHILNNRPEFGTIDNIMMLLKSLHSQHLLTAYKQFYIHSFHENGKLISEQSPGSPNPLFDLTTHQSQPAPTRPVVLRAPRWTHYLSTGFDNLTAATGMYLICLHTESHLHTTLRPPPSTPHIITTHIPITLDLP